MLSAVPSLNAEAPAPLLSPDPFPALKALCLIARLHHVAGDPAHLAHQLGWSPSHEPNTQDPLLAAKHLGLKAKVVHPNVQRLPLVPLPALALVNDDQGHWRTVVLAHCCKQRGRGSKSAVFG